MNIQQEIKNFLSSGSYEFVISNHVSGFRVKIKDAQYGETSFDTGSNIESMILACISRHNHILNIRKAEKAEQLAKRKKELGAELSEVSTQLDSLTIER